MEHGRKPKVTRNPSGFCFTKSLRVKGSRSAQIFQYAQNISLNKGKVMNFLGLRTEEKQMGRWSPQNKKIYI